jgi:ribonuclease P protein component
MRYSGDDAVYSMPTFGKSERLCNIVEISKLFNKGHSLSKYPLKLKWLPAHWNNHSQLKVVITVSKHRFKKAADRNRIKRLLRECYRLNKFVLSNGLKERQCYLGIIYTGDVLPEYTELQEILIELFYRLIDDYDKYAE